jgi:hypothetical protein
MQVSRILKRSMQRLSQLPPEMVGLGETAGTDARARIEPRTAG